MLTVTLKPELADQIEELAHAAHTDAEAIVEKALRAYLTQYRREKIQAETLAFEEQRDTLLTQYGGEYVAFHEGKVIDHDTDLRALHLRVFAQLGHTPVLLKKVTDESEPELVVRSPRYIRGRS